MTRLRSTILAVAALTMAAGVSSNAYATLLPFSITPSGIPGVSTPTGTISDLGVINWNSNALVTQNAANSAACGGAGSSACQTETGWAQVTSLSKTNGNSVLGGVSGIGNTYNLYILFNATVESTHFGVGGTISDFNFTLYADPSGSTIFNAGNATTPTTPTVNPAGTPVVIAVGGFSNNTSPINNAGISSTGAPTFYAVTNFVLCTSTAGQGKMGNTLITGSAAAACAGYDGSQFFTSPQPAFYSLAITGSTGASCGNVNYGTSGNDACLPNGGPDPNDQYAWLHGIQLTTTFNKIPEPSSLILFGSALFGFGALSRWRLRRKQQQA